MRSRNIKPGFYTNEVLASLPPLARILYSGLWCLADRDGRLEDRPARIQAQILPYDKCDIDKLLDSLTETGFITRYEVAVGPPANSTSVRCIAIRKFTLHQNPHKNEKPSELPAPPDIANNLDKYSTTRVINGTTRADSLSSDSLNLIPDSHIPGSRKGANGSKWAAALDEVWGEWHKHYTHVRNKKRDEMIVDRMKEGHTAADCIFAIQRFIEDDFKDRDKYRDPMYVFGSTEKFERYFLRSPRFAATTERAKVVSNLRAMLADGREEIMVRGICEAYEERGDHEALWAEVRGA